MVVQTPSYDTLSWIQVLLLDQISVPLSPDYHLISVFLHFVFYDFVIYLYFCVQSYVFLYFCNFDQISVALSPDCHLISVSPSSPVFLLLVLHLSLTHSHHRFTNSNTPEDKYKCKLPKIQIKMQILIHVSLSQITVWYVTASRSIPIQLFSFLRLKSNLNFHPILSESHKKSKTKMDTFIPTSWHCLQNSSSLKWLHSCGVPGEPRRMCPHNTKIRSRNSPQPLSTSLPPFLLFTNLGIFPHHKYLLRKTKSEIDKDTHILILNPKMRSPNTT